MVQYGTPGRNAHTSITGPSPGPDGRISHTMHRMGFGGFSWRRALGLSAAKARLSRRIGVPLTRSGRQRKVGALVGRWLFGWLRK